VVATVVALVLLASEVYGDREDLGGEDKKLMRDLDMCLADAPMIGSPLCCYGNNELHTYI